MAESKEGVDYKMVPVTDSKGKPVTDGKGKPVMSKKFFTRAEKAAMSTPKKEATSTKGPRPKARPAAKAKGKEKVDIASMANEAIDRSDPKRPRARPGTTRPKARRGPSPDAKTATSVSTPEVSTQSLGMNATKSQWEDMSRSERKAAGLPASTWGAAIRGTDSRTDGDTPKPNVGNTAARRARRNYNKGGMVKANCGASMKPTQKSTKKK